jgi:translation initiation factor eIF-2B subunit delta
VQFDAFAFNEIGAAESISRVDAVDGVLASAANLPNLSIINLTYDVVPAKCVRSIICEAGEIAPADVPCYTLAH